MAAGSVFVASNVPCAIYEASQWVVKNGKKGKNRKSRNVINNKQRVIIWGACVTSGSMLAVIVDASRGSLFSETQPAKAIKTKQEKHISPSLIKKNASNESFITRNINKGLLGYSCEAEVTTVYSFIVFFLVDSMLEGFVPIRLPASIAAVTYYPFCRANAEFDSSDGCTYAGGFTFLYGLFSIAKNNPEYLFTYLHPAAASFNAFILSTLCRVVRFLFISS